MTLETNLRRWSPTGVVIFFVDGDTGQGGWECTGKAKEIILQNPFPDCYTLERY